MLHRLRRAIEIIIEAFSEVGMRINWKPGKTEIIMHLRGADARLEKLGLIQTDGSRKLSVNTEHHGQIH
eukprot:10627418-Karenia_brevis.AAC.1